MGDPPSAKNQDRPTSQKIKWFCATPSSVRLRYSPPAFISMAGAKIRVRMPIGRRFLNSFLYRLLLATIALIALTLVIVAIPTTDRGVEVWTGRSALFAAVSGFFLLLQKLK
ncbi:hypothetical protein [Deinococcus sp. AJ005]|uniref:hypothetical protein n=1 Tax=Deinococcus sp. AJ005 TaxID=2652443 RepID=UPI00125CC2D4|nr:hypothetical protein [Deinococcus sp. AJ005]QFP75390.1 hypothetical protein DAAJ005_02080 [Deinococcus sp. AJ005]